ncbi:hypothetical protein P170DRAFT_509894 [Aspergillus steynii IBT 23096]|uniref:Uncharacterized protein n=1 Tax=Aspergillus steynii IBT 23096 TaxID=1392250 RepID=A0A2I2G8W8_9EURO|nr:uncharacterized protein P170DRAFT_509894 [Aspergillus steynii IBT 23096]PLB49325.1 hypothetical protein P170DRAFT_509894 [Aspergillus steynii IBT 23096]
MSLPSLPLEIFGQILDKLITTREGFYASADLRLVNRTFDLEIRRAYGRTSYGKWPQWFSLDPKKGSKCAFFAKYLLLRPHVREGAEYAQVSTLLNDLIDQLQDKDSNETAETPDDDTIRYRLLMTLSAKVKPALLRNARTSTRPNPKTTPKITPIDLLLAAIYTDQMPVLNRLLPQIDFHETTAIFDPGAANPIELPLLAAVETHNSAALHALLAHNAPFQSPDQVPRRALRPNPLLVAAQRNDIPTLTTLLSPPSTLSKSDLTYQYALVHSISPDPSSFPTTSLLLSHYDGVLSSSPYLLCDGLRAACRAGHIHIITLLLDAGADLNSVMNYLESHAMAAPIAQAAWTGQLPTLHFLLSRGASLAPSTSAVNVARTQHPGADALRAATWGNHWAAARVLLDAGVAKYLGKSDWCSVFKIAALNVDCAGVAVQLLECGVIGLDGFAEEKVEAEDAVAELVAIICQRGNAKLMRALVRHGLPLGRHAMYERGLYEVPVVQALAWERTEVVRVLEEVGETVDEEVRELARAYREKEAARSWTRVGPAVCGMPHYTVLR